MNGEDAALVSDDGGDPGFSRNVSSPGADISHNLTSTPSSTDSKGSAGRPWKSRVKSALGSLRKKRRASREKANSAMAEPSSSEDSEVVETQGGNVDAGDVVKSLDFKLSSASSGSTAGPPSGAFPSDSNLSTERSGDATDPDLLAILREVSLKSSGAGRFDDNEDVGNTASSTDVENSAMRTIIAADLDDIQEETLKSSKTEPVPVSSPRATEAPGYGIKSEFQSTFQGERGGAAEDAELLALLRGVSAKSSGADRFADSSDDLSQMQQSHERAAPSPVSAKSETAIKKTDNLPPWKRRGAAKVTSTTDDVVVVAAPKVKNPAPLEDTSAKNSSLRTESSGYGFKSEFQSTFQGERGGSAEDAELLALLRGVSAKSSGADRFADSSDDAPHVGQSHGTAAPPPVSAKSETPVKKSDNLPPWKRRGPAKANTVDAVVVAAPKAKDPAPSEDKAEQVSLAVEASGYGIKSEFQATFQGERGGSAEDAELLALLRGVSAKSSSADRFADSSDDVPQVQPIRREPAVKKNDNIPPWKRRGPATAVTEDVVAVTAPKAKGSVPSDDSAEQVSLAAESTGYGIKSEFQSTFQGERGGSAEDAELLALLRGVSSKSSGADRFADSNDAAAEVKENRSQTLPKQEAIQKLTPNSDQSHPNTTLKLRLSENSSARDTEKAEDQSLDRGSVKEALESKDWKTRVRAFEYLISNTNGFSASHELVDSDVLLEGLDAMIPRFFEDMQVAVLDKALEFGLLYANYCKGATKPEQARAISSSLLKKNAFASRPSTTSLAHSLVLKLIEVGDTGKSSFDAVVDVMLHEGLISKKPKIVQAVSIILHDVTIHFGFANLPLPSFVEHLPKLLAHTNAVVRENGLKITAEICRGLGSKAAIQNVVDQMKSAQISQLDKLLDEQSHPSPTLTGFRSLGGTSAESTPDSDAVAMLAARAEELEAERFASRPAVDLLSSLNRTEYSVRLQHPKWSEKVAALQMAFECGGQKPYKLVQPSSTVNYGPLIADMKGLLSHTHFAVCNNAMQVLCMLAEGVGEKLFPNLRPLLSTLFRLSKDKKLTKGVGLCLDSFFGNIVGFTHLLEEDALPASFDEKVEKNALARTSSMEFLGRCVSRGSKAGPRGTLDGDNVTRIASLCTEKLDDSDAAVRKASMNVLQLLIESANPEFRDKLRSFVESLRVSNPRAHKVLSKATETTDTPTVSASETTRKTNKSIPSTLETRNNAPSRDASNAPVTATETQKVGHKPEEVASNITKSPGLEEALEVAASLNIPLWGDIDENGGIYAGFKCKYTCFGA
jgi:cytoskeleton-associated protein 5